MSVFDDAGKVGNRRPSLHRNIMFDIVGGVERARKWPKKRGRVRNPITKAQNDLFREAQWATKYWDPDIFRQITLAVEGTPLLPRDLATMIMFGRLASIDLDTLGTIYPMAAVEDISQSLDILGTAPNSIMFRDAVRWRARPIGEFGAPLGIWSSRLRRAAPQAVPGGAWTRIRFDTVEFSKGDMVDLPESRLVVPVGFNRAEVSMGTGYPNLTNNGSGIIAIRKNATPATRGPAMVAEQVAYIAAMTTATGPIAVEPGDFFDALCFYADGQTLADNADPVTDPWMVLKCWLE